MPDIARVVSLLTFAVELDAIEGGGHAWPGGRRMAAVLDAPSMALNATKVAWAFFAAHPKR